MQSQLCLGQSYRILKVNKNDSSYRQKLLSMGLIPGACLKIKHIAPLGDPILFEVRGYCLSLRRQEIKAYLQLETIDP